MRALQIINKVIIAPFAIWMEIWQWFDDVTDDGSFIYGKGKTGIGLCTFVICRVCWFIATAILIPLLVLSLFPWFRDFVDGIIPGVVW